MPAVVVVGAQWGDEGKGKIVDSLAAGTDWVVRFQGGNNAGHTVMVDGATYKLHHIPSGILYPNVRCVLGNGMVIDCDVLMDEMQNLLKQNIDINRLIISTKAHLILPTHKYLDGLEEKQRGSAKIGTTKRGIGPAYQDKFARVGVRVMDLAKPKQLQAQLERHVAHHQAALQDTSWTVEALCKYLAKARDTLQPYVANTTFVLHEALDKGQRVLLEGAQGALLDIDHGTYPYVTSSHPTAGGACTGSGIGPKHITAILGVSKAYTTRVGEGPFPTELKTGETLEQLRTIGNEFGTTTNRPRRCGWLDLVALLYATRINSMTHLALTKLDVLDGFENIEMATHYKAEGSEAHSFPCDLDPLESMEPVLDTSPGWNCSLKNIQSFDALPKQTLAYVKRIEEALSIPISHLGVGPTREALLVRQDIWNAS